MATTTLARLTAIAEPTRFRIVELLRAGPRPVGGIVDVLGVGQPQVSRHLRILGEAGLVAVQPQAQQRIYRLQPRPFHELDAWLGTFTRLWEDRMDRLDQLLTDPEGDPS